MDNELTVKDLQAGLRDLGESIKSALFEFEDKFGMPTAGITVDRDPETLEVTAVVVPIFEPSIYG